MESPEVRRRTMQAVKSKDTAPELLVRRLAHRMGYRFRLHRKDLPGKPDLVFPRMHKAIFVHGCFWHGHNCARGARVPKSKSRLLDEENREEQRAGPSGLRRSCTFGLDLFDSLGMQSRERERIEGASPKVLEHIAVLRLSYRFGEPDDHWILCEAARDT